MSELPATLEWDASQFVKRSGDYEFAFMYAKGRHGINTIWVELLEDGKPTGRDTHKGFSGARKKRHVYRVRVPEYKRGAKYTLRARISSEGGTDSSGEVHVRHVPDASPPHPRNT
jgi:hypothetical protein